MIREAQLYQALPDRRVRCTACARYCNIPEGKIGLCGVRQNIDGKIHLLVYGKVITGHVDPIEKKPVVHYMPGSKIFSIARETGKQSSSESMSGYLTQGRSSKQSKRSGTRPKSTSI